MTDHLSRDDCCNASKPALVQPDCHVVTDTRVGPGPGHWQSLSCLAVSWCLLHYQAARLACDHLALRRHSLNCFKLKLATAPQRRAAGARAVSVCICLYFTLSGCICLPFCCLRKKGISTKPLLPAGYFWRHLPKHVRKRGLLLSCDHDWEHQTKSTPYHIISRYTKQIQIDTNTYVQDTYIYTHTCRYIQTHTPAVTWPAAGIGAFLWAHVIVMDSLGSGASSSTLTRGP
jgi:hypothetical protein